MIINDLKKIVNETFKINENMVETETPLFNGGLNLNSIQLLELTVSIEDFYGNEIDPDDLTEENFATISSLIDLIKRRFNVE